MTSTYLVNDVAKIFVVFGMNYRSDVMEPETLLYRLLRKSQPGYVPLTYVHYTLCVVDQVVYLTLEDRLEVILHVSSRNLYNKGKGEGRAFFDIVYIGSYDFYVAVGYLIHLL